MSPRSPRRPKALLGATMATFVTVTVVVLGLFASGAAAGPLSTARLARTTADPPVEEVLLSFINDDRAAAGVAALARDPHLDAYARSHVSAVAQAGQLFHSDITSLLDVYTAVAENVAYAGDAGSAHTQFRQSPFHYQNMVHPGYGRVGIGVVAVGGLTFAVYVLAG